MVAKIVEARPAAFVRVAVDPITLDIVENALRNARVEMDAVLFRTAMSPGIREQHDEFPLIANCAKVHEARSMLLLIVHSCNSPTPMLISSVPPFSPLSFISRSTPKLKLSATK